MDLTAAVSRVARPAPVRDAVATLALRSIFGVGRWFEGLALNFVREMRNDVACYTVIISYFIVCGIYIHLSGFTIFNGLIDQYFNIISSISLVFLAPAFVVISLILGFFRMRRPGLPADQNFVSPQFWARFGAGMVLLGFVVVMMVAYSSVKTILPFEWGFPYEVSVADADSFLHNGEPWRVLHAWIDAGRFGVAIDYLYGKGWMIYWIAFGFWLSVSARANSIRTRYVVSMVVTWGLLGNVLAGLTKCAGPIFYERVTGDAQRFGELTLILDAMAADGGFAKDLSDYLWGIYQTQSVGIGSGISAFPSLHVAIATLNALFIQEVFGRVVRTLAWLYLAFILFGSVYLGWHYAIDGYASIALVVVIYWVGRKIGQRLSARDQQQAVPA